MGLGRNRELKVRVGDATVFVSFPQRTGVADGNRRECQEARAGVEDTCCAWWPVKIKDGEVGGSA